jgi:hypothetical protein
MARRPDGLICRLDGGRLVWRMPPCRRVLPARQWVIDRPPNFAIIVGRECHPRHDLTSLTDRNERSSF